MHRSIIAILSTTALLGMQTNAHSEYITVSGADGTYDLHAGEFSGLLGSTDNQFSMSELDLLAATLHGNGIDTIGHLTFFLANTDAGVSLIGLFDGVAVNDPNGSISNHFLGVSATTSSDTDWFATGDTGSQTEWYDLGNGTQLVNAYLGWDHEQTSAGFAWGDVQSAQAGTVTLYDIDLTEFAGEPIQFVTYEDSHWDVAGTANFSLMSQYAFSYQFVPAPGAVALLALAGLTGTRRHRI